MDAAMVTAIAALIAGPVAAVAAMYGSRGANRAAREGTVVTGFNSLTDQLQEERADLRSENATLRTELAAKDLEIARLRLLLEQREASP